MFALGCFECVGGLKGWYLLLEFFGMHPGRAVTDKGARTVVWLSATLNVLF